MKKIIFSLLAAGALFACNNDKTKSTTTSGDSGPGTTNVQNVNGNQPDTTNGIKLDNRQSADTTKTDSVRVKR